jgi:uncharacterized protein (DUF2252 family)
VRSNDAPQRIANVWPPGATGARRAGTSRRIAEEGTLTATAWKLDEEFSASDRAARGRAARQRASRSSHRYWDSTRAERLSPRRILQQQDASRVPELVPVRYGRMLTSPLSFFRGAAAIMASDLARTPVSGLDAQLCGDAHLANFGVFAAPDRRLVFDLNDFDETLPGPFEWDVKRLAASITVAGRERGFSKAHRRQTTLTAVREYREAMRHFAGMRDLDVWYARLDVEDVFDRWRSRVSPSQVKEFEREMNKARRKDSLRALSKLCHTENGALRITADPPLIVPIEQLAKPANQQEVDRELKKLLSEYRRSLEDDRRVLVGRYRYAHAARKVVGVGSVGTQAWIILLVGHDSDDPLFLQAKEAQRSVLEPFTRRCRFAHQGRRVVEGQRLMQAASDIFLGWVRSGGDDQRHFYVRQLWDAKRSAPIELMEPKDLTHYGKLCGWTLARAHARSGDRVAIAAYLGRTAVFDDAVADFAEAYADQNEHDYAALVNAVRAGEITVHAE